MTIQNTQTFVRYGEKCTCKDWAQLSSRTLILLVYFKCHVIYSQKNKKTCIVIFRLEISNTGSLGQMSSRNQASCTKKCLFHQVPQDAYIQQQVSTNRSSHRNILSTDALQLLLQKSQLLHHPYSVSLSGTPPFIVPFNKSICLRGITDTVKGQCSKLWINKDQTVVWIS